MIDDFPDVRLEQTPPTRGTDKLDLVATNFEMADVTSCIRQPLETECGKKSDHLIIYTDVQLWNSDRFTKKHIWTRPQTKKAIVFSLTGSPARTGQN